LFACHGGKAKKTAKENDQQETEDRLFLFPAIRKSLSSFGGDSVKRTERNEGRV